MYTDLVVVIASVVVLAIGSNGQVFATSAIRSVTTCRLSFFRIDVKILEKNTFETFKTIKTLREKMFKHDKNVY